MVAVREKIGRIPRLTGDYDPRADVLYLTLGRAVPDEGEDRPRGIVLRFSMKDDTPSGVTVVGFSRNKWPARVMELSEIIGSHLHVDPMDIVRTISRTLK